jgi:ribokinase
MSDIVVIGSLNMDLVVKTEHMPGPGETLHGDTFNTIPGGKGANQAVAAARLGGRVAMVGRVGADGFGEALRRNLAADSVDDSHLLTDPAAPTGVALIVVENNGENRIIVVAGANHKVSPADVAAAKDLFRQAKILVIQFEVPLDVVAAVLRLGQELGVPVMVNAAPAYPIPAEQIAMIDYLVVNEHEASILTGAEVDDAGGSVDLKAASNAAHILLQKGARCVVLTLGSQGAMVCRAEEADLLVPAFPIKPVDTTAAGDAFIGGLAVSLLEPATSMREKIRFANATGAMAATRMGAQSSLPTRAEVEALMKES